MAILYQLKRCEILSPDIDHNLTELAINLTKLTEKGPGSWKFNNSLLTGKKYNDDTNKLIDNFSSENCNEPQ
jgi:hypothetical protein